MNIFSYIKVISDWLLWELTAISSCAPSSSNFVSGNVQIFHCSTRSFHTIKRNANDEKYYCGMIINRFHYYEFSIAVNRT